MRAFLRLIWCQIRHWSADAFYERWRWTDECMECWERKNPAYHWDDDEDETKLVSIDDTYQC